MNAGYSRYAFGTWPNSAPLYPTNAQPLHLYVDPVNGHDYNNQAASQLRPLRTMREVTRRIVAYAGPVEVHLKRAVYDLPDGGVFLESRMMNGLVRIFGDAVWDPTVFQTIFEGTALDGTDGKSIAIDPGDTPSNAFVGFTIETTHNGVTQRRTVRNNVTDAEGPDFIVPVHGFTNGVTTGDHFRVFSCEAVLRAPDLLNDQFNDSYVFLADCPSYPPFSLEITGGSVLNPGLRLEGVQLDGQSYFGMYFGHAPFWGYGVQLSGRINLSIKGCPAAMLGTGFADVQPEIEGWGLGITTDTLFGFYFEDSVVSGYISTLGDYGLSPDSRVELFGGRFFRVFGSTRPAASTEIVFDGQGDPNTVKVLVDTGITGSPAIDIFFNAFLRLGDAEVIGSGGGGVVVEFGATVEIVGDGGLVGTPGLGPAVYVKWGQGRVLIESTATYGDAVATDYIVDGAAAPQNKSFFAAPGDSILGLKDAGVIVRVN